MKYRYLILFCAAIFFVFFLVRFIRNKKIESESMPKIPLTTIVMKHRILDLGQKKLHIPAHGSFVLHNTGNKILYIQDVTPDCYCTVAAFPKKPIKPNDSAIIILTYDASHLGPFQASATVNTNTKNSPLLIFMRGFIK